MVKLPKNHSTVIELEKKVKEETKSLNSLVATQLRTIFDKKLAKTDAKLEKLGINVEKLIKELEVIASQKQSYGQ